MRPTGLTKQIKGGNEMKLDAKENERQIALLKEAYELARKIEELQKS